MSYISKIISKIFIVFAVIVIVIGFYSCGDDTVVNKDNGISFDSARFSWTEYEINRSGYLSMWSPDSSNIYLVNGLNILTHLHDGISTDFIFTDFKPCCVIGLANNDIYILGIDLQSGMNLPAKLKKFNGVNFTDIDINLTKNHNINIFNALAKSSNEIWFTTDKFILKYDGIGFTDYTLNDTLGNMNVYSIFYDTQNKLQCITYRFIAPYISDISLLEFQGNQWIKVYSMTVDTVSNFVELFEFGGNKFGRNYSNPFCLYSFINNTFTELQCLTPYYFAQGRIMTGKSFNEFSAVIGGFDNQQFQYICNWNGIKWSKEKFYDFLNQSTEFRLTTTVDGNIHFFVRQSSSEPITFIYRGIRKKY